MQTRTRLRGHCPRALAPGVLSALAATALPLAAGAAGFTDPTMAPSNYQINTFVLGASAAVTATGNGNPGQALLETFTVPSPSFDVSRAYAFLFNNAFTYNPAAQGTVARIDFSLDKSVTFNPSNVSWTNGVGFLLEQGGRWYETDIGLPSIQGVFQTAAKTAFSPTDFFLIVDPRPPRAVDPTQHPDFSAGPMRFGFFNGAGVPPGAPDLQIEYVFDNFSVNVTAVPEPSSLAMLLAGLGVAVAAAHRRASRSRDAQ